MWFKKNAYISGYNSNTAVDGTDWRINSNGDSWSVSRTLPSAADANKYFYLPALGGYSFGQLNVVGINGYYWSSSAVPGNSYRAYNLLFSSSDVNVRNGTRDGGIRVEPSFE